MEKRLGQHRAQTDYRHEHANKYGIEYVNIDPRRPLTRNSNMDIYSSPGDIYRQNAPGNGQVGEQNTASGIYAFPGTDDVYMVRAVPAKSQESRRVR